MKKLATLSMLFLFGMAFTLQAQQFQLLLDPVNPYQKSSLFNLSLINGSSFSGQVSLKATLKSRRGKVLMVQALNQSISANASKSIRGAAVIASTQFIDGEFNTLYSSSNQLPPMNYVLCIEAYAVGDLSNKTQECIDYQASDFINITAVYPPEEENIYDPRPQFNWINLDANNQYQYDFRLVALEKGQNKNVAMRRNAPIVAKDGLSQNQLLFPADAIPLKNNQEYVWQISINYHGEAVSKTDAFSFTYKDSEQYIDIPRNLSYVDITEIENGANLYAVGEFKFKYPSDVKTKLTAELYALKSKKNTSTKKAVELTENQFSIQLGVNKLELDLKDQVYLKHLKKYELLLKDEKTKRTYQMTITYVNPDYIK
ncbi:MAG: DUF928 domain-containing protein [Flavobacteriales bacterium]|nr:DUF928 domain-containing protein [Flavobacteriales bacterium]